jgi:cell wall-associated NlpC family hydrolase
VLRSSLSPSLSLSSRARKATLAAGIATAVLLPVTALPDGTPSSVASADFQSDKVRGEHAIQEARKHEGKPYRYGATGPDAFDCSGFVGYVYRQVGVNLPRTAEQMWNSLPKKVSYQHVQFGDLIFIREGGRISHVGMYAADGHMWVARRSGTTVTRQRIWTSSFEIARP